MAKRVGFVHRFGGYLRHRDFSVAEIVAPMKRRNSFTDCVQTMLDAWISGGENRRASDVYSPVLPLLRPNMVLAAIDVRADDPMDFMIDVVHRYSVATNADEFLRLQDAEAVRTFPDRKFLQQRLLPSYQEALEQQRPLLSRGDAFIAGWAIFYERLVLPQKRIDARSEWCIGLTEIRHLLPVPRKLSFDDVDLSLIQLLREGDTLREIAIKLRLSYRTIEHRVERLKSKLGARSLPHLVALSVAMGYEGSK